MVAVGRESRSTTAIERLGRMSPGLLLLTATPEQLGMASHFARLRLLDPDRFHDLEQFIREAHGYQVVARLACRLRDEQCLSAPTTSRRWRASSANPRPRLARRPLARDDDGCASEWIGRLLDQHGTGRVMFRNTRATVAGFPARLARAVPADGDQARRDYKALAEEWAADTDSDHGGDTDTSHSPTIRGSTGSSACCRPSADRRCC